MVSAGSEVNKASGVSSVEARCQDFRDSALQVSGFIRLCISSVTAQLQTDIMKQGGMPEGLKGQHGTTR